MDLPEYVRAVRSHLLVIIAVALLGLGAGAAFAALQRPTYESTARVFVSTNSGSSVADLTQGTTLTQQLVSSYADVATSPYVLNRVVSDLHLDESPRALAAAITATVPADSVVVEIAVTDHSAARAAAIANSVTGNLSDAVAALTRSSVASANPVRLTTIESAVAADGPASPNRVVDLALGLVAGLAAGIALVILREALDTRLRTTDGLKRLLDLPLLGALPRDRSMRREPLNIGRRSSGARAESVRSLLTNLEYVDLGAAPTLVVTSAIDGEGKSTAVANLAIALAESGTSVVVVDADLRRPRVSDYFGLDSSVGLSDVLAGRVDIASALQLWGDDSIGVVPGGRVPPNPNELVRSKAMQTMLDDLHGLFEVVIVDTPPVLVASDAAILAKRATGTLVVAALGRVRRPQLAQAVEQLDLLEVRILGVIANLVPQPRRDPYGYQARPVTAGRSGKRVAARRAKGVATTGSAAMGAESFHLEALRATLREKGSLERPRRELGNHGWISEVGA